MLPLFGLVYSPGFCAWRELHDADVEHFAFRRLRIFNLTTVHRTTIHRVGISFERGRTSLGNRTFITLLMLTNEDLLEFIRVDSGLITIATFFDGLERHMGRLAIVVGSSAEHLSLNPCLCQTVCDVLDQFGHLYGGLLI